MTIKERMENLKKEILADWFYMNAKSAIEWGWGNANKIMFVGQCPSFANMQGLRGDSDFDKFFLKMLKPLKISKKDFYFTNLIKIPVNFDNVDKDVFYRNIGYLQKEASIVKPKVIITLGNPAKEWFTKLHIPFYSLMHPSATKYGSITEEHWRKKLEQILKNYKQLRKE